MERTLADRDRGRALSKSWALIAPIVRLSSAWRVGMKIITDTTRGTLAISTGADMWELVHLKAVEGNYVINTEDLSFDFFGIPRSVAEAVRTSIAVAPAAH